MTHPLLTRCDLCATWPADRRDRRPCPKCMDYPWKCVACLDKFSDADISDDPTDAPPCGCTAPAARPVTTTQESL